jgi:secretion/DNA translocation related CpaE-like protein
MSGEFIGPRPGLGTLPVLITGDAVLLDEILRIASLGDVALTVVAEPGAAAATWGAAPLVLVGVDAAPGVVARGLPSRDGLVLVGRDLDDGSVWEAAVSVGAEQVAFLPDAEGWLKERMVEAVTMTPRAPVVCVVGGRGGAGASTLATALSLVAVRRGGRCMLIDADPLGGGLDLMLGEESAGQARRPDLVGAAAFLRAAGLRAALPRVGTGGLLSLLSWERGDRLEIPAESMRVALAAGRRDGDLVVVDLPRRPDEAADMALRCAGPVLLVVPSEIRATASAARVVTALRSDRVRVVVRGSGPSGLSPEVIAASLGLPLAGYVRTDRRLAASLERGESPALGSRTPWVAFCEGFLNGLGRRTADPHGA